MNSIIKEIQLGFSQETEAYTVYVKQNDSQRAIDFELIDESGSYVFEDITAIYFRERFSDGTIYGPIEIYPTGNNEPLSSGSIVTLQLTSDMTRVPEIAHCELLFVHSENPITIDNTTHALVGTYDLLTTQNFVLYIEASVSNDTPIHKQSDVNVLLKLIVATQALNDKVSAFEYGGTYTDETGRHTITYEDSREGQEATRVSNEQVRITNETTRQSAEATRDTNETTRVSNETTRTTNEDSRISNETARITNESTRQTNETTRENNESTRNTNETERIRAEQERKAFESSGNYIDSEGVTQTIEYQNSRVGASERERALLYGGNFTDIDGVQKTVSNQYEYNGQQYIASVSDLNGKSLMAIGAATQKAALDTATIYNSLGGATLNIQFNVTADQILDSTDPGYIDVSVETIGNAYFTTEQLTTDTHFAVGTGVTVDAGSMLYVNINHQWEIIPISALVPNMRGATSSTPGVHGLVPAPAAGDEEKVLSGAGTWIEVKSDPTYLCDSVEDTDVCTEIHIANETIYVKSDDVIVQTMEALAIGDSIITSGENQNAFIRDFKGEGYQSVASGIASHAEGFKTTASGDYSHAEGKEVITSGQHSHSEGYYTSVSGISSHAEGSVNLITGDYSHAEGTNTEVFGDSSHAEGVYTVVTNDGASKLDKGFGSHAEGISTTAIGNGSHAEGFATIASNTYTHSEGHLTKANGAYSHAEGFNTTASGNHSHSEGSITSAIGGRSHAEGYLTSAQGNTSHSEGYNTIASGTYAHVEGQGSTLRCNVAFGTGSHAEGSETSAFGLCCHAEGRRTMTSDEMNLGEYCHSEGVSTMALCSGDHSEGYHTTANGVYSHAEGHYTCTLGLSSHAEGSNTYADGICSHAEGYNTSAIGDHSHAEGYCTCSEGNKSHAEGYGTCTKSLYQHVSGRYNIVSDVEADRFIIGKGTDESIRANSFRVNDSGVYGSGAYNSSGADYAEMFEWNDGNPNNEDRRGLFVTLKGDKIEKANSRTKFILGIVSGNPSVVGDVHDDQWNGMFEKDIFGTDIYEDVEVPDMTTTRVNPETGEEETVVIIPAHVEHRQKLNPNYDGSQQYIPRSQRPEWNYIGMMGKLVVVDDGTCEVDGYCKAGNKGIGTKSDTETKYRVMKRLDDTHIQILMI